MSTHVASSSPSTLRGLSSSDSLSASSISSTIVRTSRVLLALTSTKASAIDRMSPTSRTTISSPFFSSAACAAIPARRWASETGTSEAGEGVKRRAPRSSPVSVEAPQLDLAHDFRGHESLDGAPLTQAITQVGRRDVEARDGAPLAPPVGPGRLRVHVAGPLDDHDGGEVAGLVEPAPGGHVRDRVGAEHEEELSSRCGQRLERVGGDRRLAALDLDRRRLDAVHAVDRDGSERESVGGVRNDATALLPRVTGDDEQHAVEAELGARLR